MSEDLFHLGDRWTITAGDKTIAQQQPEETLTAFFNRVIGKVGVDKNEISDGYHTFKEVYDHRIELFITLCRVIRSCNLIADTGPVWRSLFYSSGARVEKGWFLLGIGTANGAQITYHLPMIRWESCYFAKEITDPPAFDNHTSNDILNRLQDIC